MAAAGLWRLARRPTSSPGAGRALAAPRLRGQNPHRAAPPAPLQAHAALSSQAIRLRDGRLAVGVTEADAEQGANALSSGPDAGRPTLWRRGLALFLPMGYPASVAPGYAAFSRWQFVHMATGAVTGGACVPAPWRRHRSSPLR